MKTKTEKILSIMKVIAWIVFVGIMINAGAMITSFVVSIINPAATKHMYMQLDLQSVIDYDPLHYIFTVAFKLSQLLLQAYIAYLVIRVLSRIEIADPFEIEISERLERISYFILGLWVVGMASNSYTTWLMKQLAGLHIDQVSGEFIFLAGVVFVMSQIFKKGVELRAEHELTV